MRYPSPSFHSHPATDLGDCGRALVNSSVRWVEGLNVIVSEGLLSIKLVPSLLKSYQWHSAHKALHDLTPDGLSMSSPVTFASLALLLPPDLLAFP